MWPIVIDRIAWSELIKMLFGLWTRVCPRKHVLHGSAHQRNLTSTTELYMCGYDVAFLSNYFDRLF